MELVMMPKSSLWTTQPIKLRWSWVMITHLLWGTPHLRALVDIKSNLHHQDSNNTSIILPKSYFAIHPWNLCWFFPHYFPPWYSFVGIFASSLAQIMEIRMPPPRNIRPHYSALSTGNGWASWFREAARWSCALPNGRDPHSTSWPLGCEASWFGVQKRQ